MKTHYAALLAGVCAVLALPAAMAADGKIQFNGEVTGSTCDINAGHPDFIVTLPPVSTTALKVAGAGAGTTRFNLVLSNCDPDTGKVATYFEAGPTINSDTGRLINGFGVNQASNVEVALLNDRAEPMLLNRAAGAQNSQVVDIAGGGATLDYFAQYVATADNSVTAGQVSTHVFYSLVYQ